MSEHAFDSAPDMGHDFQQSHDGPERPLEHDAQNWEPTEEPEIEEPSEKHPEMHLRPGGSLEQEVHTEIDDAARKRILEVEQQQQTPKSLADEQELDFAADFEEARRNPIGWDPESRREYEALSEEKALPQYDDDPFETGKRFERETERERGDDDREH